LHGRHRAGRAVCTTAAGRSAVAAARPACAILDPHPGIQPMAPRQYSMGGRSTPGAAPPAHGNAPAPTSLRERVGALRNLPPFIRLVWRTSPWLTAGNLG